jgi:sugar phosphate isomerase/epimerase
MALPIALQLYSVRNECAQDLFGVLKEVARMGYDGVEFAGYHGHSATDIRKALDDLGLKAEGTHTGLNALDDENFDATVELHHTLGCKFVIIPWMPEELRNSPDAARSTAERLTVLTQRLSGHGLQTGFHAHDGDMRPLAGGPSAWDIFAQNTPKEFIMQYDTANGMAGGADPVQPVLDWPGRSTSVHLKEWSGQHGAALIGDGEVPWPRLFEACESVGGTQWYVVEHESEMEIPPMEAVDRCLQNLRAMGK